MAENVVLECPACAQEFSVAPPPSEDLVKGPVVLGNTIVYACPRCGAEATYEADEFKFAE
jgi:predicted RNA-binding Zn-ribbon protein involved in translation (DUF1610 family)